MSAANDAHARGSTKPPLTITILQPDEERPVTPTMNLPPPPPPLSPSLLPAPISVFETPMGYVAQPSSPANVGGSASDRNQVGTDGQVKYRSFRDEAASVSAMSKSLQMISGGEPSPAAGNFSFSFHVNLEPTGADAETERMSNEGKARGDAAAEANDDDGSGNNSFLQIRKDDIAMRWFPLPHFIDQKTENSFCEFVFHGRKLVAFIVFSVSMEFVFILAFYSHLSVGYQVLCIVGMVLCCLISGIHVFHCFFAKKFTPHRIAVVEEGSVAAVFALTLLSQAVLAYPKQAACADEFPEFPDSCKNYVDFYLVAAIEAFCVIAPARFMFVFPITIASIALLALTIVWNSDGVDSSRHWTRVGVELVVAVVNLVSCVIRETSQRMLFENYLEAESRTRVNGFAVQCTTQLLSAILPSSSIQQIRSRRIEITKCTASVFRSDIIGFTSWSSPKDSFDVVDMLKSLVDYYDGLATRFNITKVKTIGDAYWAIKEGGEGEGTTSSSAVTTTESVDAALKMAEFATRARAFTVSYFESKPDMPSGIRIGVATGSLCHTTVGTQQISFEVFGEATDRAEALEQSAPRNAILIDHVTAELLTPFTASDSRDGVFSLSPFSTEKPSSSPSTRKPLFLLDLKNHQTVAQQHHRQRARSLAPMLRSDDDDDDGGVAVENEQRKNSAVDFGNLPHDMDEHHAVEMAHKGETAVDLVVNFEDSQPSKELKETNIILGLLRSGSLKWTFLPRFDNFEERFVEFGLVAERVPFRGCGISLTVLVVALAAVLTADAWSDETMGNIIVLWVVSVFSGVFPVWSFVSHPKSRLVTSIALVLYYICGGIAIGAAGLMKPSHYLTRSVFYLRLAFAVLKGSIITVPNTPGFLYDIVFPSGAVIVVTIVRSPENDAEKKLQVEQIVWLIASFYVGYLCRIVMELSNRETFLQVQRSMLNRALLLLVQKDARRVIESAVPKRFTLEIFRWYFEAQRQALVNDSASQRSPDEKGRALADINSGGGDAKSKPASSAVVSVEEDGSLLPLLPDLLAPATVQQKFPNTAIGFIKIVSSEGVNANNTANQLKRYLVTLSECFAKTEQSARRSFPNVLKIKTVANTLIVAVLPSSPSSSSSHPTTAFSQNTKEEGKTEEEASARCAAASAELFLFSVLQLFSYRERGRSVSLQIGLHLGQVTGCVLGTSRLSYDLLGDAMNTASRLCSTSKPNEIAMSMEFQAAVRQFIATQDQNQSQSQMAHSFQPLAKYCGGETVNPLPMLLEQFSAPLGRAMKGKGELLVTCFALPRRNSTSMTPQISPVARSIAI